MRRMISFIGIFFLAISSFGQIKVTSVDVNFRSSPKITDNKIGLIPKGTAVIIVQDSNEHESWTKKNYNGKSGYVNNSFLVIISDTKKTYNSNLNTSDNGVKYYKNSKGEKVQSPTRYDFAPAGATVECNDGTYSFSRSRRGTCSHHGGVKRWLK